MTLKPVDSPWASAVAKCGPGELTLRDRRCLVCGAICTLTIEIDGKPEITTVVMPDGARGLEYERVRYEEINLTVEL